MLSDIASEKAAGKQRAMNAIFGLVIALSSFILLNTINPHLVNLTVSIPTANLTYGDDPPTGKVDGTTTVNGKSITFTGALCPQVNGLVSATVTSNGQTTAIQLPIQTGQVWPSDSGIARTITTPGLGTITIQPGNERNRLQTAGISINAAEPSVVGSYKDSVHITSVYGLPEKAIQGLIDLKSKCNCTIVVSGGTECWEHATHGPGLQAVDLSKSSSTGLASYIYANGKKSGSDYYIGTTDIYDEDSAHFHVRSW